MSTNPFVSRPKSFGAILSCCLFALPVSAAPHSEPGPDTSIAGVSWIGPAGVRERTADIMEREARQTVKKVAYRQRVRRTVEFVEYVDGSQLPTPAPGVQEPEAAGAGQTAAMSFLGATLTDTRAYPPDSMGAVGPSQYIVAVNGRVRSFNKLTGVADGVLNVDTDVFFNPVMTPPAANNFTSDPRIRYDRLSQRWFIIMIDVPGQVGDVPNRVMIAVSDGPIITAATSWTFFYFPGDASEFADYPTLGIDANALYIGVNLFGTRGRGTFDNTTGFVVRKSSLLVANNAPANLFVTAFQNLVPNGNSGGPYTPQGVDNYDPNATEGYFIGVTSSHNFIYFDRLSLRRVSNPGGTPTISGTVYVTIPPSGGTINVPHLGNTGGAAGYLDGLDYRLLAAHIRNGRLWTAQNMAVDNTGSPSGTDTRMGVRWYELAGIATGQTPSVVQAATLFQPSAGNTSDQRSYWMGSIMVSGQGHAAMGFSVAGANEFVNAGWAGRLAGDPINTLRTPTLYTSTSAAYNPRDSGGAPIDRWGDYSYTCLDPDDDMTMWTIEEFCSAPNSYGVQVAKLLAPPPAIPTNCNPASVNVGSSVSVAVTGMSDGDTGFFDPGAGFSNRISAFVSGGGVTINSIAYSNPTHITLNLSVSAGAAAGPRTITVTNPDGQSAISPSALLTLISATNPPVADFVGLPTTGSVPLSVFFTNLSTLATSYSWDFGDGQTSTSASPAHVYTNAGVYTVGLTAFGPVGSNNFVRANYIFVTNVSPFIVLQPQSLGVPVGADATFSVSAGGTAPLAYQWRFNTANLPGATSSAYTRTNAQPVDSGDYSVLITNLAGSITSLVAVLTVTNPTPVADFVGAPRSGSVPLSVFFTNLSTLATSYSWDFGDGQTSTSANPAHVYTNAGVYTVGLTAFGPVGSNNFVRANYIFVTNVSPFIVLQPQSLGVPVGADATFSVSAGGTEPLTYQWRFNTTNLAGATSTAYIRTNTQMADAGEYSVLVTNLAGSVTSLVAVLTVTNPAPGADFAGAPTIGAAPLAVYFTNMSILATSYTWEFGDGHTSTDLNPVNVYSNAGSYHVRLTAIGSGGSNSLTRSNYVILSIAPPLVIEAIAVSNSNVSLSWTAISNRSYRVQYKDDLSAADWTDLPPDTTAGGSTASQESPAPVSARFYRVRLLP